jgi:hypothetical protein
MTKKKMFEKFSTIYRIDREEFRVSLLIFWVLENEKDEKQWKYKFNGLFAIKEAKIEGKTSPWIDFEGREVSRQ